MHWLGKGIYRKIIVRNFGHFIPLKAGTISDRPLKLRQSGAVGDDIHPVVITAESI